MQRRGVSTCVNVVLDPVVWEPHHRCGGLRGVLPARFLYLQAKIQELAELKGAQWQAKAVLRGFNPRKSSGCVCGRLTLTKSCDVFS